MKGLTLREILTATGGVPLGGFRDFDMEAPPIVTNSKEASWPSMFVPYRGARNDGHDFIEEALDNGCIGCFTERELPAYRDDKLYVRVDSAVKAVWEVMALWRSRLKTKLICVTGSVGKTTTTGMIASVLRRRFRVFETVDNCNDEFLAPEMISRIEPDCEFAVLELGFGTNSSVSKMAKILRPDVMVLTNVGYAHIRESGSLERTRDEKCGTEKGLAPGGFVVINGDDPLLRKYDYTRPVVTYGADSRNDVSLDGSLPVTAQHLTYPTLAAATVGRLFGLDADEIASGVLSFRQESGRMDVIERDGFTLIDSSFNASPASMKMALDTLSEYGGKRIAVLGDMLELGAYADELHAEIGAYATSGKADVLIAVGKYADAVLNGMRGDNVAAMKCADCAEAFDTVSGIIRECRNAGEKCVVMCKGSHGSNLHRLAGKLKEL